MNALFIFSRVAHIFGSVLWVGSAIFYLFLIAPSVKASGPAGGLFMKNLINKANYPMFMSLVSLVTILSGAYLYVVDSGGLQTAWLSTGPGLVYTIGAVVGIAVFFLGLLMIKPRAERLNVLGRELEANGGKPTPAQAAEMGRLNSEMHRIEQADFVMLTVALLAMALARYL